MRRKGHTVSRFYLKGFLDPATPEGKEPWVWMGNVRTGEIKTKAPVNVGAIKGFYEHPGGLGRGKGVLEDYLGKIESKTASVLKEFEANPIGEIPSPIMPFIAWGAVRTPAAARLFQQMIDDGPDFFADGHTAQVAQSGPDPFAKLTNLRPVDRPMEFKNLQTGCRDVMEPCEKPRPHSEGWRLHLRQNDFLEVAHLHFTNLLLNVLPRMHWFSCRALPQSSFITGDRPFGWSGDSMKPWDLRHPSAFFIAPMTSTFAFYGHHSKEPRPISAGLINHLVACLANEWIAGSSREVVEHALHYRSRGWPAL